MESARKEAFIVHAVTSAEPRGFVQKAGGYAVHLG